MPTVIKYTQFLSAVITLKFQNTTRGLNALITVSVRTLLFSFTEMSMVLTFCLSGVFVYTSGSIIVTEDLNLGTQRHLTGEPHHNNPNHSNECLKRMFRGNHKRHRG